MSEEVLFDEALKLSVERRAELAVALLESLDGELDEDVEAAWAAEIVKRVADVEDGSAKFDDWDAVRDRARERLRHE